MNSLLVHLGTILFLCSTPCEGKNPLYLGAILPYSNEGWIGAFGKQSLVGTNLAVEDINKRSDVLADYTLYVIYEESMASSGLALNALFDMYYSPPTKIAFIGEMQSTITEALAEVTGIWKTIQVNQASSSPNLSDRNKYPYFFRALGPPYNLNDLQSIVLQEFNWAKVAVIHEGKQPHSGVTDHLQQTLHMNNVSILASESFYNDPADAMARLKNKDVRIIIGNFDQQMALDVFCNAFKLGMYGPKYVFFIVGYYSHHWWKGSPASQYGCDVTEMEEVVEGYFSLTYSTNGRIDKQTVSGRTPDEFRALISVDRNVTVDSQDVTSLSYDIVWALALGLNSSTSILYPRNLSQFTYSDEEMADIFRDQIKKVSFYGASGPLAFTSNGDRIGTINIEQNRGGVEVVIGTYYPGEDINWLLSKEEIWKRNGGAPPFDSDITKTISLLQSTPVVIFIIAFFLCCIGVALAVSFLVFNFRYRKERIIKMSSPNLNNVIVAGFMLAYVCVIVIGLDLPLITKSFLRTMCEIRVWVVTLAFTLAFGGMFTKMWRVYSIVIAGKTKRKVIKDRKLIGIVGLLFAVDLIVLIPRQIIDPFRISELRIPIPQTEEDIAEFVQYELLYVRCTARFEHIWVPALICYKAILMLFGAFLSLQTRKINIPSLNDASYVGLSIYNVCICSFVAMPLSLFNTQEIGVTYAIVGGLMLFCTTVSLCMLFIPKIIALNSQDPNAAMNGVRIGTMDSKTVTTNSIATAHTHINQNTEIGQDHSTHHIPAPVTEKETDNEENKP